MFLWSLEIVTAVWFGYEVVGFFTRNFFTPIVRLAMGIPLGQYVFAWIVFLISSNTALAPVHGHVASLFQLGSAYFLHRFNKRACVDMKQPITFEAVITAAVFGGFGVYFMYYAMLLNDIYTIGAGYGDFPFHLNIISSFVCGVNQRRRHPFDITSSFYAGEPLAYPVMTNFYTAVLMVSGRATQRAALLYPSVLILLSLFCGIYVLSSFFSKRKWTGALSLFLFLNLGGLCYMRWTTPGRKWNRDFVFHWGGKELGYWFHPIMHILVPQRASLFSMPLCYWTLYLLAYGVEYQDNKLMYLAGIFTALCPQFQVHSYVGLAQWAIVFCALKFPYKQFSLWKKYIIVWACYGFVGICFGLPQFYPFLGRLSDKTARASGFLNIYPTYKKFAVNMPGVKPTWTAFFIMWWRGLGVFAFIALTVGFINVTGDKLKLYIPSVAVWLIANFILYQPWECDNLKVHYAAWIPYALPVVSMYFLDLFRKRNTRIIGIILLVAATLSAATQTKQALARLSPLFRKEDVEAGLWAAENTPAEARFLSWLWHANPPATLGGKELFMGYGGWVVSHGLDFRSRAREARVLLTHPDDAKKFIERNIFYVYSRSTDSEVKSFNEMHNNTNWKLVAQYHNHKYWKLNR